MVAGVLRSKHDVQVSYDAGGAICSSDNLEQMIDVQRSTVDAKMQACTELRASMSTCIR